MGFGEGPSVGRVSKWHQGELFPRVGFIVTNLSYPTIGIVRFYNGRGTAEQWIKEGKHALNWTRLSCHKFVANQVRLGLFIMAYNLGNFLRRLVFQLAEVLARPSRSREISTSPVPAPAAQARASNSRLTRSS